MITSSGSHTRERVVSQHREENTADPLRYSGKMGVLVLTLISNERNKLMICPTMQTTLEVIMLRERSQTEKNICREFHPYKMLENASNSVVAEGGTVAAWRWGRWAAGRAGGKGDKGAGRDFSLDGEFTGVYLRQNLADYML